MAKDFSPRGREKELSAGFLCHAQILIHFLWQKLIYQIWACS